MSKKGAAERLVSPRGVSEKGAGTASSTGEELNRVPAAVKRRERQLAGFLQSHNLTL